MSNKEQILCNLEYLGGGMTALKCMCGKKENNAPYYELMEEWNEIIYDTIGLIKEDYEICQKPLTNLQ